MAADELIQWQLRDGTPVALRRVRPEDKPRFRAGVKLFSPETLYRRFFAPVTELSEEQLTFLTDVDQENHLAWGALDEGHPELPGLGVARCVRLPERPVVAETAIIVMDSYQGRGLGTLLLAVLNVDASRHGIEVLRSLVLAENTSFIATLKGYGGRARHESDGILAVDLPVYKDAAAAPDTDRGRRYGGLIAALADRLPA